MNIGFQEKKIADITKDDCVALPFWQLGGQMSWFFDPWGSNKQALTTHAHCHTTWVLPMLLNWFGDLVGALESSGNFEAVKILSGIVGEDVVKSVRDIRTLKPANFDWEAVYIVGRGKSLKENAEFLNRPRKHPAVFINHAFTSDGIKPQPHDFSFVMDNRVMNIKEFVEAEKNLSLIAFAAVDPAILGMGWNEVYGTSLWSSAPLNQAMQFLFPHLPALSDVLSSCVGVTHLAGLSKAKTAVFVGTDFTRDDMAKIDNKTTTYLCQRVEYEDINGDEVATDIASAITAAATMTQALFCKNHVGTEFVNACGRGLLGLQLCKKPKPEKVDWIKFESLESVMNRIENA